MAEIERQKAMAKEALFDMGVPIPDDSIEEKTLNAMSRNGDLERWADLGDDDVLLGVFESNKARLGKPPKDRQPPQTWWAVAQSEIKAIEAGRMESVREFRKKSLGKAYPVTNVAEWIRAQAKRDGTPSRWAPLDDEGKPMLPFNEEGEPTPGEWRGESLAYPIQNGEARVLLRFGGKLWKLRSVAGQVAAALMLPQIQALALVLTGEPPPPTIIEWKLPLYWVPPDVQAPFPGFELVQITASPFLSPDGLHNLYTSQRTRLIGKTRFEFTERQKTLAVFRATHPDLTIEELRVKWNKTYPKWKVPNYGNFHRDVNRAYEVVRGRRPKGEDQ